MTRAVSAEPVTQRLADIPADILALELLVLFGSAAKGRAGAGRDIDLAVRCEGAADVDALYLAPTERLSSRPRGVDDHPPTL